MSTNMKDIFQTVYKEIELLEQSIISEQATADADAAAMQESCTTTIADLEGVEANAKAQTEADTAAREGLENDAANRQAEIAALEERYERNQNRTDSLSNQRCTDAMLFVQDLMSHKESLELLEILQQELVAYFASPDTVGLLSIMTKVELLETYTGIFKEDANALAQIKQILSTGDELYAENELAHGEETKNLRTDNDQPKLTLNPYERSTYELTGNLEVDINRLVQNLIDHMYESIKDLEENEIQAAHDFAKWQRDIEKENEANRARLAELQALAGADAGLIEAAKEAEAVSSGLYEDAMAATADMRTICEGKAADYDRETAFRSGELTDVQACLRLFEAELLEDNTTQYTKDVAGGEVADPDWEVHDTTHDRTEYEEAGTFTHAPDEDGTGVGEGEDF